MFYYIIRRVLIFVPTLLIISLIAFGLSKMSPGDPVGQWCESDEKGDLRSSISKEKDCLQIAKSFNLDKPSFYFSITSAAYPDTLYKFYRQEKRIALSDLCSQYGNWPQIDDYYKKIKTLDFALYNIPDSLGDNRIKLKSITGQLPFNSKEEKINSYLLQIENQISITPALIPFINEPFSDLKRAYTTMQGEARTHRLFIPSFNWYGSDNQYHHWFSNFIRGNFGISYADNRPVSTRIWEALQWTLLLNILALLFAYGLAIPIGIFSGSNPDTFRDRFSTSVLYILYSLPSFWVASLLVTFFTTGEFGMDFFPTGGTGLLDDDAPFWNRFWDTAYHLILPVFCISYAAFAFISRQVRGGLINELNQDYIRTAYAKGLSKDTVVKKHGFRNALFPLITLFANILPATIAGSVIIEVIFSIPGMGRLAYNAIFQEDWPIVFAVLMLSAVLTIIGNLLADILYAAADPRISFEKNDK